MNTSIFRDKSVCVVGNSKKEFPEIGDSLFDVFICCNKLPTNLSDKPSFIKAVIFWDSCPSFDVKKHGLDLFLSDFVYIYALRPDINKLVEYLKTKDIPYAVYCPACRTEHADNDQINGTHWALPLTNRLQGRPFTGFLAIYKALIDGAKSVLVTGFDFYRNSNGWQTCVGPHNIENHVRWLKEMVETEGSRIRLADDVKIAMDDYFKWKVELKTV